MTASDDPPVDTAAFDRQLQRIYRSGGDKQAEYDDWAATYEADLLGRLGYVAHERVVAAALARQPARESAILDLGCGTGLAGRELRRHGFSRIDGADFSAQMRRLAARCGAYDRVVEYDVIQHQPPLQGYDLLICVGVFGFGPPHLEHLHHAVSTVKPGGDCLVTVNGAAWQQKNLAPQLAEQARRHHFRVESICEIEYLTQQQITAKLLCIVR